MDTEQLLQMARRNVADGDLAGAKEVCDRLMREVPAHTGAIRLLALIRYREGDIRQALVLLQRAVSAAPEDAAVHDDYATLQLAAGQVPGAIESFRRSLELRPANVEARVNLGNALHQFGDIAAAEEQYRLALDAEPTHARGLVSLGNLLRVSRRNEEAIACLEAAVRHAPGFATAHNFLGVAKRDAGRYQQAIACFDKALQFDPEMPEAHFNLGGAAKGGGDFKAAISHFERVGTPIARASVLECLLNERDFDGFFSKLGEFCRTDPANLYIAAISAYASQQLDRADPYPFCPDPLSFVRIIENPKGMGAGDGILAEVTTAATRRQSIWEPRGISTVKGFQSAPTLFDDSCGALDRLRVILEAEVVAYKTRFSASDCLLIRRFPEAFRLNAWFVRLLPGGHQKNHSHPQGWLSGVVYLQMPATGSAPEGSIEFSLRDDDYPDLGEFHPTLAHQPAAGQLVLFPSSLFHRTLPFTGPEERLCIAFDVVPR